MSIVKKTKRIKFSKVIKKKTMKRNNKKSVELKMRGGMFLPISFALPSFSRSSSGSGSRKQTTSPATSPATPPTTPPVSTQYQAPSLAPQSVDPLVTSIAQKISESRSIKDTTKSRITFSLIEQIKQARDAVELKKKAQQTSPNYKQDLLAANKLKKTLRKSNPEIYKIVRSELKTQQKAQKKAQKNLPKKTQ